MGKQVTLNIDGKRIQAQEGDNLLKTAKSHGINIPSLCWHEKLSPTGACRLCITKIKGINGHTTACTTQVKDGMEVTAFDEELETARRDILDLLLTEHNEEADGSYEDEFEELVLRYGLKAPAKRKYPSLLNELSFPRDDSSPVLVYDAAKCVKCYRCVKACDEIQGKNVLSFAEKGISSFVVAGTGIWKQSECDGCGECVQLCPTGALVEKPLTEKVRLQTVEQRVKTTCTYCGVGCQMELWVQNGRIVRVTGHDSLPNQGRLCVKGRFGYEFVHSPQRLKKPLVKKNGSFVEVSMEEALNHVARGFSAVKKQYGPKALGGFSSAKCTNEENYLFQKLFRAVIGTNSVEHCARLCHASTVTALQKAIGSGAMGNSLPEFEHCDCLLVIGSNPLETHPVSATYIKKGVKNGAKIVVIDPRKTPLTRHAALWLRQKPGTDVALINGLLREIIINGWIDREFIKTRVEGGLAAVDELMKVVDKYTPELVEEISGVSKEELKKAAQIYGKAKNASVVTGMGMSQSTHGTHNVLSLINLALITGNYGRESTGVNPLRGQNNVQGASDMGCLNNVYPGYQPVNQEEAREKFAQAWGVAKEQLDKEIGLSAVEMVQAAGRGEIKAIYIMGENPMLSDPNLGHTQKSLQNLDFLVVQDIFLTETAQLADVVLPASSFAEKEGTFTNTDRRVLRVRKAVDLPGEALEDWRYIMGIAVRMGYPMDYESPEAIMAEIARLTPSYQGISYERLEAVGLQWPCPTPSHPGTPFLHKEGFPRGAGKLHPLDQADDDLEERKTFPFILNTGRTLYHYHTATMTRRSGPLNEYIPEAYLEMNPLDLARLGLTNGELVRVSSPKGSLEVKVRETDLVAEGELFLPFHFKESAANLLTSDLLDPFSKIPRYKQSPCRVEKIEG